MDQWPRRITIEEIEKERNEHPLYVDRIIFSYMDSLQSEREVVKEKTEQNKFMEKVTKAGGWVIKTHGTQISSGLPDTVGALKGIVFGFEWKVPGEEATKLQQSVMNSMNQNGIKTGMYSDCEEAWRRLITLVQIKEFEDNHRCDCGRYNI